MDVQAGQRHRLSVGETGKRAAKRVKMKSLSTS